MSKVLATVNVLLIVGYPFSVYFGLTHASARGVGILLFALLVPSLVSKLRKARREDLVSVLRVPLAVMAVALLSVVFDDPGFVLAMPVLINLVLLATFASSLRTTPLVERFARMEDPNLGPAQVAYCRSVTIVWCCFFVFNAAVSASLALFAPLSWWALYNGAISYVLIGVIAATEYLVRKARFREYGPGLHDRLIERVFPKGPGRGVAQ